MSSDLFKAILAMDAYNRGYNEGIKIPGGEGTKIGNATILLQSDVAKETVGVDASFYAIAYQDITTGAVTISYRGTDNVAKDSKTGFGIGGGSPLGDQAWLAFEFYNAVAQKVTGKSTVNPLTVDYISLTGHSLGGGLAGLVGAVYGNTAVMFDNMPFEKAAQKTYEYSINPKAVVNDYSTGSLDLIEAMLNAATLLKIAAYGNVVGGPVKNNFSNLTGYYVDGEFLSGTRSVTKQSTIVEKLSIGTDVDLPYVDDVSGPRHSMSLLVLCLYGKTVAQDWKAAAKYFIPQLFDSSFGKIIYDNGRSVLTGINIKSGDYAEVVRTSLAYSAIDEGGKDGLVFGNTGIKALFDDANNLGVVLSKSESERSGVLSSNASSISKVLVQFAGQLALNKVETSDSTAAANGVLSLSQADSVLTIKFDDALWSLMHGACTLPTTTIIGRQELVNNLLTYFPLSAVSDTDAFTKNIDRIVLSATNLKIGTTLDAPADAGKINLCVSGAGADEITGSSGNDYICGNVGNDTIYGSGGSDYIVGGDKKDTDTVDYSKFDKLDKIKVEGLKVEGLKDVTNYIITKTIGTATYTDKVCAEIIAGTKHADNFAGTIYNDHFIGNGADNGRDTFDLSAGGKDTVEIKSQDGYVNYSVTGYAENDTVLVDGVKIVDGNQVQDGTTSLMLGSAEAKFSDNCLQSLSCNASSYYSSYDFGINSIVTNKTVNVSWSSDSWSLYSGSVVLDLTDSNSQIVSQSLGYTGSDGSLEVNPSQILLYNAADQKVSSTQVYADGSMTVTQYNLTDGGSLKSTGFNYATDGSLNSLTYTFGNGNTMTIGKDTANLGNIEYNATADTLTVPLTSAASHGNTISWLNLDAATGDGTLQLLWPRWLIFFGATIDLSDWFGIDVSGGSTIVLSDTGTTVQEAVLGYLSQLGNPMTLNEVEQHDFNCLSLPGPAREIPGYIKDYYGLNSKFPTDSEHVNVYYTVGSYTGGAVIAGQDTVWVHETGIDGKDHLVEKLATNILYASGWDYGSFAKDTISNIDILYVEWDISSLSLTQSQFDSIGAIYCHPSSGSPGYYDNEIVAVGGGTFDLRNKNADTVYYFVAGDFIGTTLIGNDKDHQYLTASTYGNDTLIAGNGEDNVLTAGYGVCKLIGGNGGDTFVADDPGAGTSIEGGAGTNYLVAHGDFTKINITNVQVLILSTSGYSITLTADQFSAFNSVEGLGRSVYGSIYGATGGVYDLKNKNVSDCYNLYALSSDGTTLIGNDADYETLTASAYGNDTLIAGNGNNVNLYAFGGSGNCTLIAGNGNYATLTGGGGNDTLIIGKGNSDWLCGGAGNDILNGTKGNGYVEGGAGNDTYIIDNENVIIYEYVNEGTEKVKAYIDYTLGTNVENLYLYDTATKGTGNTLDNSIYGNSNDNTLSGLDGNDTLYGKSGNDTLNGGAGKDTLTGGTGDDTYYVDNTEDVLSEKAGEGTDRVNAQVNYTLGGNLENLYLYDTAKKGTGNNLANVIYGNSSANSLYGLSGDDKLYGKAGDDTLNGGTGNDTLTGGTGDDTYYVDSTGDVLSEKSSGGNDRVNAYVSYTLGGNLENLYLYDAATKGTGNELVNLIYGNDNANKLYGLAGNDKLYGNAGNDTLNGGTGDDCMYGGKGDDTYYIDSTGDIVSESAGAGTDRVNAYVSYTLGGNLENLYLYDAATKGTGNDLANVIYGNSSANSLYGLAGNDKLYGKAGNDTLNGGLGNDTLTGGTGDDIFRFDSALSSTTNLDKIADFNIAENDVIQLENAIFTKLTTTGKLAAKYFHSGSGAVAQDANDYILYDTKTGGLYYDADGTGSLAAVQFATLVGTPEITSSDFYVA